MTEPNDLGDIEWSGAMVFLDTNVLLNTAVLRSGFASSLLSSRR